MAIKRIIVREENCTGCRACELACSFQQKKAFHYDFSLIHAVRNKEMEGFFIPLVCYHCEDPPCAKECPTEAIKRDDVSGIVSIDKEKCTGCGMCVDACPWSIPRIDSEENIASICNLCNGDPLCVKFCSPAALLFEYLEAAQS
jgi:carbon-monoxide dehydrogenase iron sulfur subunit